MILAGYLQKKLRFDVICKVGLMYFRQCHLPVQVLLHGPNETPKMIEQGLKISPGFLTAIAVSVTEVSKNKLSNVTL